MSKPFAKENRLFINSIKIYENNQCALFLCDDG